MHIEIRMIPQLTVLISFFSLLLLIAYKKLDGHDLYVIILRLTIVIVILYVLDVILGSAVQNTIKESHPGLLDQDPFAEQNPQSSAECLKDNPPDKCNVEHDETLETICSFPPEKVNGRAICPPGFIMVRDMEDKPAWYTGATFQNLCCELPNDDDMHKIRMQNRMFNEIGRDILMGILWGQFADFAYQQMVKSLSRTAVGQSLSKSKAAFAAGVKAKVNATRRAGGRLAARTAGRVFGRGTARSAARAVGRVTFVLVRSFSKIVYWSTYGALSALLGGPVGVAMLFVDLAFAVWDLWDPSGYNNMKYNHEIQDLRDIVEYQFQSSCISYGIGSYPAYFQLQWMYPNEYARAMSMLQGYYLERLYERAQTDQTISDVMAEAFIASAQLSEDPTDTTTVADQIDPGDGSAHQPMRTMMNMMKTDMNSDLLRRDQILELFLEREICWAKKLRTDYDVCDWWHFNQCTEKPSFARRNVRLGKKWREVAEEEFDYTPNPIEDDRLLAEINKSSTQVEYTRAREFYQARGDVFVLSRPYVPGNTTEMAVVMCSDRLNPGVLRYFEPVMVELHMTARFRDNNENYHTQTKICNKIRYADNSNVRYKKWVEVHSLQRGVQQGFHQADGTLASLCNPASSFTAEGAGNYSGGRLYVLSDFRARGLSFNLHPNKIVKSGTRYFRQAYMHIPEWPVYTNRKIGSAQIDVDLLKIDVFLNDLAKHTGVCTGHTALYLNDQQASQEVTSIDLCNECECLPGVFKYNNEYFQTLPPLPWCSNKVDQRGDGYKIEIMGNANRFRGPNTVEGLTLGDGNPPVNPNHWETTGVYNTPQINGLECTSDRYALQPSEIACHLWNYYHETEWFLRDSFSTPSNEFYVDGWVCPQVAIYTSKFGYVIGGTNNTPQMSTQSFGSGEKRALVIYGIDAVYKMCLQPTGGGYPNNAPALLPWPQPDDNQRTRVPRQYGVWFDYENRICRFNQCWCESFQLEYKTDRPTTGPENVDNGIDCHLPQVQNVFEILFGTSIVRAIRSIGAGDCQPRT